MAGTAYLELIEAFMKSYLRSISTLAHVPHHVAERLGDLR